MARPSWTSSRTYPTPMPFPIPRPVGSTPFRRTRRKSRSGKELPALQRPIAVLAAVETQEAGLAFNHGRHARRSVPNAMNGGQGGAAVIHVQVHAFVAVVQEQLAAVVEIGVLDGDERLAEIG